MGTWLETYDVLFWVKDKKIFVSRNHPLITYALSLKGYKLLCDGSELFGRFSRNLDEENGAIELSKAISDE